MENLANVIENGILPSEPKSNSINFFYIQWKETIFSHWNLIKRMEN